MSLDDRKSCRVCGSWLDAAEYGKGICLACHEDEIEDPDDGHDDSADPDRDDSEED